MQVRCKFGTLGPGQFQFNAPHGFCLGIDEEIVVADTHNHRIVVSLVVIAESLKQSSHNLLGFWQFYLLYLTTKIPLNKLTKA